LDGQRDVVGVLDSPLTQRLRDQRNRRAHHHDPTGWAQQFGGPLGHHGLAGATRGPQLAAAPIAQPDTDAPHGLHLVVPFADLLVSTAGDVVEGEQRQVRFHRADDFAPRGTC
jgi:hypothetical protein